MLLDNAGPNVVRQPVVVDVSPFRFGVVKGGQPLHGGILFKMMFGGVLGPTFCLDEMPWGNFVYLPSILTSKNQGTKARVNRFFFFGGGGGGVLDLSSNICCIDWSCRGAMVPYWVPWLWHMFFYLYLIDKTYTYNRLGRFGWKNTRKDRLVQGW